MKVLFELDIPAIVEVREGARVRALGRWERGWHSPLIVQYADCEDGLLYESPVDEDAHAFLGYVADVHQFGDRTRMRFASHTFGLALGFANQWEHSLYIQVPALWSAAEERRDLEAALLPNAAVARDREWRPSKRYEIGEATRSLAIQARVTGAFEYEPLAYWFGTIVKRVDAMFRLLNRAEHLEGLNEGLGKLGRHSSGSKLVYGELRMEATSLLEQAAWTAYATLDVLSLVVNHVYGLGRSPYQCHYRAVLGIVGPIEDEAGARLSDRYPDDVLTKLLLERETWVEGLRSLRHSISHSSNLLPVEGPPKLTASLFGPLIEVQPFLPVEETVRDWTEKLVELLDDAFAVMRARADAAVRGQDAPPVMIAPTVKATRCEDQISDSLVLLRRGDPEATLHLYSRFDRDAKREWSFPEFERYLARVSEPSLIGPYCGSIGAGERSTEATFGVWMGDTHARWRFRSVKRDEGPPRLSFRRPEWPPSAVRRVAVEGVAVRQDNRRVAFFVEVRNETEAVLDDVVVAVYQSDSRWAENTLGPLAPGGRATVAMETSELAGTPIEGVGMPMMGLLMEPVAVQVTYQVKTDEGSCWSEEYPVATERGAAVRSRGPGRPRQSGID